MNRPATYPEVARGGEIYFRGFFCTLYNQLLHMIIEILIKIRIYLFLIKE